MQNGLSGSQFPSTIKREDPHSLQKENPNQCSTMAKPNSIGSETWCYHMLAPLLKDVLTNQSEY